MHAERGVPGTRSCGFFCLSAERQLALSGLAPFAALCAAPAERQLALSGLAPFLLPFVRHRLSDSSPFRGLPLSALVRHQRSVSSATRGLPLSALCAAPAERQLCLSGLTPLLPIHGTAAARGSGGATALPHLVPAPGTECALQLARCASGYDGDLYWALPFVGHWCPDFAPHMHACETPGLLPPSAVRCCGRPSWHPRGHCPVWCVARRFARLLCPLSGCASAPHSDSSDRCMGPLRMA